MKSTSIFLLALSFIILASIPLQAETIPKYTIEGRILEEGSNAPLPYVSISINSKTDSSLLSGTITDQDGYFELKKVDVEHCFLQLSFVGFQNQTIDITYPANGDKNIQLGDIIMTPAAHLIEGVVVSAKASPLSSTINKQVINAEQNINAAGGSAVDLLRNSASIEVSSDDEVTLRGSSNFIVLLDGKPSALNASDILNQTPASQIKQIEIITNPPVKYAAEGGAGVINIIRRKGLPNSLNALVNLSAGTKNKYGSNATINWNTDKINLSAGIDWNDNSKTAINEYEKIYTGPDTTRISTLYQDRAFRMSNLGFRLGLNYDPNDKQSLNYSLHSGYNQFDLDINANTHGSTLPENKDMYHVLHFNLHQKPMFLTNNLGFSQQLNDKGSKLDINAYYSYIDYYFNNQQSRVLANSDFEAISAQPFLQDVINNNFSNDLRTTLDLNIPVRKGSVLESGLSWHNYLRTLDVQYSEYDYNLNSWLDNPFYTHVYDFNESVYAAYASLSGKINDYNLSAGLRAEYMDRYLMQTSEDIQFDYKKLNWFPSLNISRNFNQKHDLGLAFSNRINRPNEYMLNPFPEFEDDYFYSEGNPNLIPEIIRNLELNYRFIHDQFTLSTNVFLRSTDNKIEQLMEEGDQGKLKLSHHNDASDMTSGVEVMANINLLKWWSMNASTSGAYHQIKGQVAGSEISKSNVNWSIQMVNSFSLGKNTSIQSINFYRSKTQNLQYDVSAFHFMDLAINQKFLDGKLSVGLQAKDIFRSMNYELKTKTENTDLNGYFKNESPVFMINVSYQINQYSKKTKDVETKFDM